MELWYKFKIYSVLVYQQGVSMYSQECTTIMEWTMGVDNVTVQWCCAYFSVYIALSNVDWLWWQEEHGKQYMYIITKLSFLKYCFVW